MPRFGKDKNARNEELDRQAAEEVERLTRRGAGGGGGGMPGMPGMGGPPRIGPPSPLEMMAAEVADRPPPSRRRAEPARRPAPRPQQAFTAMPSGGVGSSFGPGGLNPGPRGAGGAPPPPSFGAGAYDEDYGGAVTGPPVYNAEPDEEEEMSITEMALMDHAARTGHNPEDLVMQYDASSAEEMRDRAMRQFHERQQSRGSGGGTNDPFAPAGQRRGPSGPAPLRRSEDPAAAGGALAQRLAARRRREEEEARRAAPQPPAPAPPARSPRATAPLAAAAQPAAERDVDDGALARVLARRRAALGVDAPAPAPAEKPASRAPGRSSAGLRAVPEPAADDADEPVVEEAPPPASARKPQAAKKTAPAAKKAPAKKAGATLATAPAKKATPAKKSTALPAAKAAGKAKTVFCIECGEKNPAIAKFCFNCGTRVATPEG